MVLRKQNKIILEMYDLYHIQPEVFLQGATYCKFSYLQKSPKFIIYQ